RNRSNASSAPSASVDVAAPISSKAADSAAVSILLGLTSMIPSLWWLWFLCRASRATGGSRRLPEPDLHGLDERGLVRDGGKTRKANRCRQGEARGRERKGFVARQRDQRAAEKGPDRRADHQHRRRRGQRTAARVETREQAERERVREDHDRREQGSGQ